MIIFIRRDNKILRSPRVLHLVVQTLEMKDTDLFTLTERKVIYKKKNNNNNKSLRLTLSSRKLF